MKSHILIIYSLFFILILFFLAMFFFKKDPSPEVKIENKESSLFLQGIDFSDGNYSLYIHDPTQGEFMIFDEAILEIYQNQLKIQRSLFNYFPGEADRSKGFILMKDRSIVKSIQGAIFKKYELGDILTYAQKFEDVIEDIYVSAGKKELLETYDFAKLRDDPQIYNLDIPEFPEDGLEYAFFISLPSVLLEQNNILEKEALEKSMLEKVSQDFKAFGEFSLPESLFISQSEGGIYLQNKRDDMYIQNKEEQYITLEGYALIQPRIYIRCSEAFYKKMQTLDFKKHFLAQKYSDVIRETALKDTLKKNNISHIFPNDVYIADWSDELYLGELRKQEYILSYWKLR